MRRALAIDEKAYGPDHPKVAIRPQQSGDLTRGAERLDRRRRALPSRQADHDRRRRFGADGETAR